MTCIAIALVACGLVRLVRSLAIHAPGRNWAVLTGGIAVLLGLAIWLKWPIAGLWFVGLCLAVDFICHGLSWSATALAQRNLPRGKLA
jgi:uncharacterized membrane protein HdeD (DUF308 family)